LDYRLIEFAFGKVPSQLKATRYNRKILLKFLAARVLPKEFDRNRKQGFSIPMAAWLNAGKFRNFFQDILLDPRSIFDLPTILSLFKGQDHGCNNSERLFALVLFELWRREYAVSF
jgi:asparagine synthase (glutamine-hydrolysing)